MKPRIPISARPFYEGIDGLRAECLKLCRNVKDIDFVNKKKSIAQLEKWLKADSRTRGMSHYLVLNYTCYHLILTFIFKQRDATCHVICIRGFVYVA